MKITDGVLQLLRETETTFKHIIVYNEGEICKPKTMMSRVSEDVLLVTIHESITDHFERYRRTELMRRIPNPESYVDRLLKILPRDVFRVEGIMYVRDETGKCTCRVITTPYVFRYLIDSRSVVVCNDCLKHADIDRLNACTKCEAIYCYDCSRHMATNPVCRCGKHLDIAVVGIERKGHHMEPFFVTNDGTSWDATNTTYHACINKRLGDPVAEDPVESPTKRPRTIMDMLIATPITKSNSV